MINRAVKTEIGAEMFACTQNTDRTRVSTVSDQYSLYEWFGTRRRVCEQGAGLMLRRLDGGRWKVLRLYLPTDTYCGNYMERVYLDLLDQCIADDEHAPMKLPLTREGALEMCPHAIDSPWVDGMQWEVSILRNLPFVKGMWPTPVGCVGAMDLARRSLGTVSVALPAVWVGYSLGPKGGVWTDMVSSTHGRVVVGMIYGPAPAA